ncbi:MAG: DUF4935 domain-containing protein [Chloracidobacterium sp.]|nr:DUF4935 domain-containing protein [Chloracidobacterium sp.]MCO5334817.1 PIN domain-containing protein [Pyrinomonadaceae bacterium]
MAIKKLLFVDTNIWLDFYRARTEAGLALLRHLESNSDKIIVSYQVEAEFKKNRQMAILEGMRELKSPQQIVWPGMFSDAQATRMLQKNVKEVEKRVKDMKKKLGRVLSDPAQNDVVYQACQRIFHRESALVLTRDDPRRKRIRNRALRRFLHGCPPRKKNDTSLGDVINWEWMVECAITANAELTIVSRDSDYGVVYEDTAYINDHLRHEFSDRVSKKRKLILYAKLSEALRHFKVPVTNEEAKEEDSLVASDTNKKPIRRESTNSWVKLLNEIIVGAKRGVEDDDG